MSWPTLNPHTQTFVMGLSAGVDDSISAASSEIAWAAIEKECRELEGADLLCRHLTAAVASALRNLPPDPIAWVVDHLHWQRETQFPLSLLWSALWIWRRL